MNAPTNCARCPRLVASRHVVVNGSGPIPARVLVVAQNPGREEEVAGYPLCEKGWSGSRVREKLLPLAGLDPAEVRFENIARCRPPRGKKGDLPLLPSELANCAPFLTAVIEACQPQIIVAVGAPALAWFLPKAKLAATHGQPQPWRGAVVVGMYHPAAAHPTRNPGLAQVMVEDWTRLGETVRGLPQQALGAYREVKGPEVRQLLGGEKMESLWAGVLAFDLETDKASNQWRRTFQAIRAKIIGFSIAVNEGEAYYCPDSPVVIRDVLGNPLIAKVAHNAVYEYLVCAKVGIRLTNLHCTKLMAYILGRSSTHLKDLAWSEFGIKQTRIDEVDWADAAAVAQYGAADSDIALRLFHKLGAEIRELGLWPLYELERAALPVLAKMTLCGICIDTHPLIELQGQLETMAAELESDLRDFFQVAKLPADDNVNLNSDDQLRLLLYGPPRFRALVARVLAGRRMHVFDCARKGCVDMACAGGIRTGAQTALRWFPPGLGWRVKTRTKGGDPAVDMDTIRLYDAPVVGDLVKLKSIQQALENNVTRLPELVQEDGRIHPTFHQAGQWEERGGDVREAPITGRTSSSGPNLQNITHHGDSERPYVAEWAKDIRRAFVAAPGLVLFRADIGQEEPRIAAFLADDEELLYELEHGDVYCPVASLEFGREITRADGEERQIGKRGFMAWLNGAGPAGIQESAFWLTRREANGVIKYLQNKYPKIEAYRASLVAHLHERGYTATHFGRRIHRPEVWSGPGPALDHAERSVMPDAIQGTAADVMKLWLPRIVAALPDTIHLLLTIHDEVVGECRPADVRQAQASLETALVGILPINLPCEFYAGPNWTDMVRAG